jgi:hypothetical protein
MRGCAQALRGAARLVAGEASFLRVIVILPELTEP